jgi:hypothetical protein
LDGSLTRLPDPDAVLRSKIIEFVERGSFGLASGRKPDGAYFRVWFKEFVPSEEIEFSSDVYLVTKERAKKPEKTEKPEQPIEAPESEEEVVVEPLEEGKTVGTQLKTLTIRGSIPSELWNRLGTRIIPKLKQANTLKLGLDFSASIDAKLAGELKKEIEQIISDLKLTGQLRTSLD